MAVQAKCKKCGHVCAADNPHQFTVDYDDDECEEGGKHDFGSFEETTVDDTIDWENFSGQIAL